MLELTFFVLLFGLIFIGYRLNKSLKIQRELLNDVKQIVSAAYGERGALAHDARSVRGANEITNPPVHVYEVRNPAAINAALI